MIDPCPEAVHAYVADQLRFAQRALMNGAVSLRIATLFLEQTPAQRLNVRELVTLAQMEEAHAERLVHLAELLTHSHPENGTKV